MADTTTGPTALVHKRPVLHDSLISHARLPLCITDPTLPDNPIVYVNKAFCDLTGYAESEVLNRNCRFLQGPDTAAESVDEIRRIIESRDVATVELINYRKDGSRFINALQIGPIYDDTGEITYFFGSQLDVTAEHERREEALRLADAELRHRLRNLVSVMSVLVRLTGRESDIETGALEKIVSRLQAVGDAHLIALTDQHHGDPDLRTLADTVLSGYAPSEYGNYRIEGPALPVESKLVTVIAMTLHELATNAVKHGALSRLDGEAALTWAVRDGNLHVTWRESGGPPVEKPSRASGSRIIQTLIRSAGGALDYHWNPEGLMVDIRLPHVPRI